MPRATSAPSASSPATSRTCRPCTGNFDEARALYGVGRGLIEEVGATVSAAATALQSGVIELLAGRRRGRRAGAPARATTCSPAWARRTSRPAWRRCSRTCSTRMGRDAEAVELRSRRRSSPGPTTSTRRRSGGSRERRRSPTRAGWTRRSSLARAGVELLERTDAPIWRADSLIDLAEVLVACGAADEARARVDGGARASTRRRATSRHLRARRRSRSSSSGLQRRRSARRSVLPVHPPVAAVPQKRR